MVRLQQSHVVDLRVVVGGTRRVIVDSADKSLLQFRAQSLRLCGGFAVTKLKVAEVREVGRQAEGLNGGKK